MRDLLSLSQRVRLVNSALVTPEEKPLCMSLRECANNIGERLFDDVDGRIMYYDLDFLEDIITYLNDFIDEIVIVDGPYSYCVEFLKKCNLLYDENTKPSKLSHIIEKFKNKVSYYYSVWENEKQKRITKI